MPCFFRVFRPFSASNRSTTACSFFTAFFPKIRRLTQVHVEVVVARINPETGLRVADGGLPDYFYQEFLPQEQETVAGGQLGDRPPEEVRNQLF